VIRVANAPCSWGVLEFEAPAAHAGASQVLDEMAAAGYAGTELGDWGFLPTSPTPLAADVARRHLVLVGAFVAVALARADALDDGIERAVRTARLLAAAHAENAEKGYGPFSAVIVLADDNTSVPHRTARAGRIREEDGLDAAAWDAFAGRAEQIAAAVRNGAGVRTVFHHHCGGYVETPQEIHALMSRTDAALLGLCLDTGHLMYAGGNPIDAIAKYRDRIWHVHFKDCDPALAHQAREEGWDYHTAVRRGIFCELGQGMVPFRSVLDALRVEYYAGWIVVEQDVLPGLGTPAASAARNREYLRRLGL
jgi:inosose dehydratase